MRELSITGYGEIEVKSKREAAKLDKFLRQNKLFQKPTHKIKVKIEGFIDQTNINHHDGTGQPFGLEITKATIAEIPRALPTNTNKGE